MENKKSSNLGKKILPILIIGVLVLSGVGAVATPHNTANADLEINRDTNALLFDDELEVEITGGIGVHLIIRNVGDVDVFGVEFDISVIGGILGMINDHYDGIISSIPFDSEFSLDIPVFGFGPIDITATVEGGTITAKGFVLLFFILIPS